MFSSRSCTHLFCFAIAQVLLTALYCPVFDRCRLDVALPFCPSLPSPSTSPESRVEAERLLSCASCNTNYLLAYMFHTSLAAEKAGSLQSVNLSLSELVTTTPRFTVVPASPLHPIHAVLPAPSPSQLDASHSEPDAVHPSQRRHSPLTERQPKVPPDQHDDQCRQHPLELVEHVSVSSP